MDTGPIYPATLTMSSAAAAFPGSTATTASTSMGSSSTPSITMDVVPTAGATMTGSPQPRSPPSASRHQHTLSAPHLTYGYESEIVPEVPPVSGSFANLALSASSDGLVGTAGDDYDAMSEASGIVRPSSSASQQSPAGHASTHRRHVSLGSHPYASSRASSTTSVSSAADDWASEGGGDLVSSPPASPTGKSSSFAAIGTLDDLRDGPDGPNGRPGYAYVTLIRYAILGSPRQKLTLGEIYDAIEQRYPYYKTAGKGWKNSVRHNLSLNRAFKKEPRHILDPGKGSYWRVDLTEEISTSRIRNRKKPAREATTQPHPFAGMASAPFPPSDLWAQQPRMPATFPPYYPPQHTFQQWQYGQKQGAGPSMPAQQQQQTQMAGIQDYPMGPAQHMGQLPQTYHPDASAATHFSGLSYAAQPPYGYGFSEPSTGGFPFAMQGQTGPPLPSWPYTMRPGGAQLPSHIQHAAGFRDSRAFDASGGDRTPTALRQGSLAGPGTTSSG